MLLRYASSGVHCRLFNYRNVWAPEQPWSQRIVCAGGAISAFLFCDVCALLTTNLPPEKGWPAAGCVWLEVKLTAASWVTPSICDSLASAGWSWRSPITTGPVQVPLGTLHPPPHPHPSRRPGWPSIVCGCIPAHYVDNCDSLRRDRYSENTLSY